jgi:hypothetical protein
MSSAILMDFSTAIPNNNDGNPVWAPYLNDNPNTDPNQTGSIVSGSYELIVGADSSPYVQFQPLGASGYNHPGGYLKSWLKSGETWSDNFNRMSLMVRYDTYRARVSAGTSMVQMGCYIRGTKNTSSSYQGHHPYHHFNLNIPANRWVKYVMTNKPNHMVGGDSGLNWPPNYAVSYEARDVQHGSTSQSSWVRLLDPDGTTPITSLTFPLTNFNVQYTREGNSAVNITTSQLGAADAAFSSGGMFHVGDGWWRIDVPDAAWLSGISVVRVGGSGSAYIAMITEHTCTAGSVNTSPDFDTEITTRPNYFSRMTRFYFDPTQGSSEANNFIGTWHFDDFRVYEEPATTPEHEISNPCIYYTGTRYEVEANGLKDISRTYEVRYRTDGQSMRANGFASGTDGGTRTNPGNTYTHWNWASPDMAESTNGIYVALRVQGETDFMELFFPYNFGPGNDGYAEQYEGEGGGGEPGTYSTKRAFIFLR